MSEASSTESAMTPVLVRAALRETVPHTPVWFMRQAGRSLPEYRKIREGTSMLESCRRPELISEITLQPVRRHDVDAAIFFSDIVVPIDAIGFGIDIKAGIGPVVDAPFRTEADLDRLPDLHPDQVPYITESIHQITAELGPKALIGFVGAPFTLASYLIEGGPSKSYIKTKAMMYGDPELWNKLCARLATIVRSFLKVQIDAGARAVQLFDSWAGALSEADYRTYVLPHSATVMAGLDVPRIHFGIGTAHLLSAMSEANTDVVGVDWRTPLDVASQLVGPDFAVQGNLDPTVLFAPPEVVDREVRRVLAEGAKAPGHIFNLGHGVMPETDPDVLTRVVELVHEISSAS